MISRYALTVALLGAILPLLPPFKEAAVGELA